MYARGAYMGDDLPMVFLQELCSNAVLSKEAVVSTTLLTIFVINPRRRACAERVTVVVSCVCLYVCMYVCPNTLFW